MHYRQFVWYALIGAAPALAQPSADQILEKYAQAIGGQAAYEKVTTRVMKGEATTPDDDSPGILEIQAKAPDRYHVKMSFPDGVLETVLDGDKGWEKNPDSLHAMSRADLAAARRDHHFYRETRLKELFPKMEGAGTDHVNGRSAYVIQATPADGPSEKLYFDAESGLLVKRDFERITLEDGIVQYEVLYSDYRDVDGIKLPFTIESRTPDSTMIWKFSEIKNNAVVEDAAFAMPGK